MARTRRTERNRGAAAPATRPAREPATTRAPREREPAPTAPASRAWLLAIPLALVALLIACRNAPLGSAVADDYSFLARLAFQKPLDVFDSMGATYYWRPLSRQLYFSLVGPWLLAAPWAAALLHGALIAGIAALAYRISRREFTLPVAAMIAASIAMSEPARVLLGWPSGSQHLLAALFALLAVHEAQARRLPTAALAAFAGLLSHESAALALPVILGAAWRDSREPRAMVLPVSLVAGVAALWAIGYRIALEHGVATPPAHSAAAAAASTPLTQLPALFAKALPAALNLEDVHGTERGMIVAAWIGCAIAAAFIYAKPAARKRLRAALPATTTAAAWFFVGVMPLALLLPDWNGWRAWTPSLGLAFAIPALLGSASPWLAGIFVTLRLVALLISPGVDPLITRAPAVLGSHVSFTQLVRLQRVVDETRKVMLTSTPSLKPHDRVCYWELPRLAEFAFQGSRALQVWYADSTLSWGAFGGQKGLTTPLACGIEYRFGEKPFAAGINHRAIVLYQEAAALSMADQPDRSDELLRQSMTAVGYVRGPFVGTLVQNLALNAYRAQRYALADSLNEASVRVGIETGAYWLLHSASAFMHADTAGARNAIQRSLEFDPSNSAAQSVARQLGVIR